MSDISIPASLIPPSAGNPTAEQERFRQEIRSTLPSILSSAAPGTVCTYDATSRAIAPKVTATLSLRALPMDSGRVFLRLLRRSGHSWPVGPVFSNGAACWALELPEAG